MDTANVTKDEIVKMMVGRVIYGDKKEQSTVPADAPVVLEVKNLSRGKEIRDVSFTLRRGEILGFSGLMGAGRTELAEAIFGADPADSGEIILKGESVKIRSPLQAKNLSIGLVTEDRKETGLVLPMDVTENTTITDLKSVSKGIILDRKAEEKIAQKYVFLPSINSDISKK